MEQMTFKKGRRTYIVDIGDSFMDNGARIQFHPIDDSKRPTWRSGLASGKSMVCPKDKDWKVMLATGRFVETSFGDCNSGTVKIYTLTL